MKDFGEFDFLGADAYATGPESADLRAGSRSGGGFHATLSVRSGTEARHTTEPVFSVSAVCGAWKRVLQGTFPPAWVSGEIASITRSANGHLYFDLKDEVSRVRCAMFRFSAAGLNFSPQAGDQVEAYGGPDLYAKTGSLQLKVTRMRKAGLGRLYELFEALKRKLAAEGLFDAVQKRPVPAMPRTVGIVSSLAAAGLRDALKTLARRAPYARIIVYPTSVQGAGAGAEIVAALRAASARREADVLLLVRGGGSFEDLAAFNTEAVARAIRACRIPVISGIGHEVDTTIADLAADLRAATPTAAAECCAPDVLVLIGQVLGFEHRLRQSMHRLLEAKAQQLDLAQIALVSPRKNLRHKKEALFQLITRLRGALEKKLLSEQLLLSQRSLTLQKQGKGRIPEAVLALGRLAASLKAGEVLRLQSEDVGLSRLSARLDRCKPEFSRERARIDQAASRLREGMRNALRGFERNQQSLSVRLAPCSPQARILLERSRLVSDIKLLRMRAGEGLALRRQALEAFEARLLSLDFKAILARGYAMVLADSGRLVGSAGTVKTGETVRIVFSDGTVYARVTEAVRTGEKEQGAS